MVIPSIMSGDMLNYEVSNNILVISLFGNLNARLLDELAILSASKDIRGVDEIVIDFTKTGFIKIGAFLSIVSFIEYLNQQKDEFGDKIYFFKAIIPPALLKIFNSLRVERFFDISGYAPNYESESKYYGFLPILKIPNGSDLDTKSYDNFADGYINTLVKGLGDFLKNRMCLPEKEIHDFFYANSELLKNIYEHSNGIGFAGIAYSQKLGVTCCYYDLGVGFAKTVSRVKQSNIDSIDAIKWATEPNNTSKTNEVGGAGLSIVKNFVQSNNGILEIRSGNGRARWSGKQQKYSHDAVPEFLGSQINLNIPPKK